MVSVMSMLLGRISAHAERTRWRPENRRSPGVYLRPAERTSSRRRNGQSSGVYLRRRGANRRVEVSTPPITGVSPPKRSERDGVVSCQVV